MKKLFLVMSIIFSLFLVKASFAKSIGYGIPKPINHERPSPGLEIEKMIEDNNGIYIGPDEEKVYLTFDCGYENGYTEGILDILKEYDIKACFFITGHYLTSSTSIVKRMEKEGHIVGNHTYSHLDFTKRGNNEILKDIKLLEDKYEELIGSKIGKFVRPPEGKISDESLKCLNENGYKTVMWSLAYVDWYKDKENGYLYSYNNVMNRLHNGAIILMHTVSKDNLNALEKIIQNIKLQGFKFDEIDTI